MASLAGLMRFAAIRRPASSRKGPPQVVWRSFATLSIKELRDLGVDTAQRGRTAGPHASEVLHFLRHAGLTQQELTRAVRRQPELLDANPAALEASAATLQGMLGSSTLTTLRDCPEVLLGALLEHQRLFDEWGLDVEVLTRSPRILLRVPRELRCVLEFLRDDALLGRSHVGSPGCSAHPTEHTKKMSKNAEKSYEDLVAEQVKALQVPEKFQLTALAVDQNLPKLCRHHAEMEALRLELTGHFSPDQPVPVPDVLNDAMENEEEPSEELSLSPMERWTTLTERLMDEHEWMTSVTGASPFGREKSHVHDLHMRRAWGTSIMSKRRTPAMRASVALPYANSALRINEAQTDSSFLSFFVVRPQSNMQLVWSIAACILIMWDMITIPLEFFDAGELQMVQNVVNIIAFVFWLLDMPLNCFFGVFRHGVVELRPKVLAGLYFRSWFGVDLLIITIDIARFIAEALLQGSMSSSLQGGRYLRALRILRLLRLTRIGKLQKKFALLANRFLSTYVFMVLKVIWTLTLMLAINHIIACCWYGVAMASIDEPTWLSNVNLDGSGTTSVFDSYVASLHWSLTQFTPSTNNIAPANALERSFAVFVILLAMGFFSSFVGSITSTVNSLRSLQAAKVKQQDTLLQFFVERNMSLDLYSKVQEVIKMEKLAEVRLHETDVALVNSLPERFRIQLHE
ncbi:Potassium channel AKT1, partial [Durusdinium trenchii]